MKNLLGIFTSESSKKDFNKITLGIASPEKIKSWSYGEVTKPETINYRTFKPEQDGLFCSKIFGPDKDYECLCGKYKRIKFRGVVCEKCGVEVISKRVRRERMGHIKLACPVAHIWFFKSLPSRIGLVLGMRLRDIEQVLYFESYVVTDPRRTDLDVGQILSFEEYKEKMDDETIRDIGGFQAGIGAEGLRELLKNIDLDHEIQLLRDEADHTKSASKISKILKRLKLLELFRQSGQKPEWMMLDTLPVLPPDLRPLVALDGGRFTTSDLNDLYRRVINRNNRLKRLIALNAPDIIVNNEKRMLQEAVDTLIDNSRRGKMVMGTNKRPLKSLADIVKGKSGRFRQNLLGKRVDFSGRSVIVCGPTLALNQCGLPKQMAMELFKPFLYHHLIQRHDVKNIKLAKRMIDNQEPIVWDILDEVIQQHPVLLNRAPTLHRGGLQAFQPVLIEGKAIQLPPLVCTAFNADYDGDQMAVHVPLSLEAQMEAHVLMMSSNNLLAPANGEPIVVPTQDIVLGLYYLTSKRLFAEGEGGFYGSIGDMEVALESGALSLHAQIKFLLPADDNDHRELVDTTPGRMLLYETLPRGMAHDVVEKVFNKAALIRLINQVYREYGRGATVQFTERLMRLGFKYATMSGISVGVEDMVVPADKKGLLANAEKEIKTIQKQYTSGFLTEDERYNKSVDLWDKVSEVMLRSMMDSISQEVVFDPSKTKKEQEPLRQQSFNSIFMMADSGARGSQTQIKQLAAMRGLMTRPDGSIIETPITANFREGLTVLQYFISTHGARKGLADTALKTANSGYLTRRLVDVAQDLVITQKDCGSTEGIVSRAVLSGGEVIVPLLNRILGRVCAQPIHNPMTQEILFPANTYITEEIAERIVDSGVDEVVLRSPVMCELERGICCRCYGRDLARGEMVSIGEAIGVIAAQSIGEPGTQLTMRTFHIGGAASRAVVSNSIETKTEGIVRFSNIRYVENRKGDLIAISRGGELSILDPNTKHERERYRVLYGMVLKVRDGNLTPAGVVIAEMDSLVVPVISEYDAVCKFEHVEFGVNAREQVDEMTGLTSITITENKRSGKRRKDPCIQLVDGKTGKNIETASGSKVSVALRPGMTLSCGDGDKVYIGDILATIPQEVGRSRDITGGLPRVAELFEVRKSTDPAVLAAASGVVSIGSKIRNKQKIIITDDGGNEHEQLVPAERRILVSEGNVVKKGDELVDGEVDLHEVLQMRGVEALTRHIVSEIQDVYRLQGVVINDKHIEVIVHQMLRCVRVIHPGDSNLVQDEKITLQEITRINKKLAEEDKKEATYQRVLLGITKASLSTESFISAAAFQETTRVLTEAAVSRRSDDLLGLKENVIIGKLIPAGTGSKHYRQFLEQSDFASLDGEYESDNVDGPLIGGDDNVSAEDIANLARELAEEDVATEEIQ